MKIAPPWISPLDGPRRLTAPWELGAKTLLALVVPETAVAYRILALNIEKSAHLRERALGVARTDRNQECFETAIDGETLDRYPHRKGPHPIGVPDGRRT